MVVVALRDHPADGRVPQSVKAYSMQPFLDLLKLDATLVNVGRWAPRAR